MRAFLFVLLPLAACAPDDVDENQGDDTAVPEEVKLAYDDGVAESAASPWGTHGHAAEGVHFTAPAPTRLVSVAYWVAPMGVPATPFDVEVWGWDTEMQGPSDVLLYTAEATPAGGGQWLVVDLRSAEVDVETDFLVAMVFTTPPGDGGTESLLLGVDESAPDARSYVRFGGGWRAIPRAYGFQADFMVRATVEGVEE